MPRNIDLVNHHKARDPEDAKNRLNHARRCGKYTAALAVVDVCGDLLVLENSELSNGEYDVLQTILEPYQGADEEATEYVMSRARNTDEKKISQGKPIDVKAAFELWDYAKDIERQTARNFVNGHDLKPYLPERLYPRIPEIRKMAAGALEKSEKISNAFVQEIRAAQAADLDSVEKGGDGANHVKDLVESKRRGTPKGATRH